MMAEMARDPPNLDQLMNEGIAFVIDQFKTTWFVLSQCLFYLFLNNFSSVG